MTWLQMEHRVPVLGPAHAWPSSSTGKRPVARKARTSPCGRPSSLDPPEMPRGLRRQRKTRERVLTFNSSARRIPHWARVTWRTIEARRAIASWIIAVPSLENRELYLRAGAGVHPPHAALLA